MDNFARVIGKAVGREEGLPGKSEYLIIEDKSEPEWPKIIPCEFYGDQRAKLQQLNPQPGDYLKVEGQLRGNRSIKGKLFLSFVAYRVTNLNHLFAGAKPPEQWPEKHQPQQREPGEDNDDLNF